MLTVDDRGIWAPLALEVDQALGSKETFVGGLAGQLGVQGAGPDGPGPSPTQDFQFILKGIARLLSNPLLQTYLPNSTKKIQFHQELLVLFWKLCDFNKVGRPPGPGLVGCGLPQGWGSIRETPRSGGRRGQSCPSL